MKPSIEHIAGLETLHTGQAEADTAVVILHGYGANMHDLFPLWEMWDDGHLSWYFPNGLLSLPMGFYEGRAWFSIDVAALEKAMREGSHRDLSLNIPPEFEQTLQALEGFLRELSKKHRSIILGGFSQGAMCSTHLAMKSDLPIKGLILLSGNLIAESKCPPVTKGMPFYQSHGKQDPILPFTGAKQLEQKLLGMNFQGRLQEFTGGHEIPSGVIQGVKYFLEGLKKL